MKGAQKKPGQEGGEIDLTVFKSYLGKEMDRPSKLFVFPFSSSFVAISPASWHHTLSSEPLFTDVTLTITWA